MRSGDSARTEKAHSDMDTEVDLYNGATNKGGDGRLFSTVRDLLTTTPKRHEATTITIAERNELQVFDRKLCSP